MVSSYNKGARANTFANDASERSDALERELSAELGLEDYAPPQDTAPPPQPSRTALSAFRGSLDQRMREWRGSARILEQCLRQLMAAEQARAAALAEFERVHAAVAQTSGVVTQALAALEQSEDIPDIDPLFERSKQELDELDRITGELSITQEWCRSAWKQYAEALRREQVMRLYIQTSGQPS